MWLQAVNKWVWDYEEDESEDGCIYGAYPHGVVYQKRFIKFNRQSEIAELVHDYNHHIDPDKFDGHNLSSLWIWVPDLEAGSTSPRCMWSKNKPGRLVETKHLVPIETYLKITGFGEF